MVDYVHRGMYSATSAPITDSSGYLPVIATTKIVHQL